MTAPRLKSPVSRCPGQLHRQAKSSNRVNRGKIPAEAAFVACLVYFDGIHLIEASGEFPVIIGEERGTNGFGYDPIFYLPEYQLTMAEINNQLKTRSATGPERAKL